MEISSAVWTEVARDNDAFAPSGFATGVVPDDLESTFREIMAALKRDWSWARPLITPNSVSGGAYLVNPVPAVPAYANGLIVALNAIGTLSWNAVNVSGLGSRPLYIYTHDGIVPAASAPLGSTGTMPAFLYYDASLGGGSGGFVLFSQPSYERISESITCPVSSGVVTTGVAKFRFQTPFKFTLTNVYASLVVAQSGGAIVTADVNVNGATLLSTKLSIDNGEYTSRTAATQPVISGNGQIADDAIITIDVDQIGDGTASRLTVDLVGYQTP